MGEVSDSLDLQQREKNLSCSDKYTNCLMSHFAFLRPTSFLDIRFDRGCLPFTLCYRSGKRLEDGLSFISFLLKICVIFLFLSLLIAMLF